MATSFSANKEGRAGDWKCVITNKPWADAVDVYLLHESHGKFEIANLNKDGTVVMKELKEGADDSKPFFTLPYFAWQSVLQAMGDVEPDIKKEVVDSELKATKYHLEDMRKLLKIK